MISTKWVITDKGAEEHPIAKAPLEAREFNTGDKRGELFAGTPGFDGDENSDFLGDDDEMINHAGRCQGSLPVWRRQEVVVRGVCHLKTPW